MSPPLRQAQLSEVSLGYWDSDGEGPALVLLHPGTGSHAIWVHQHAVLAQAGYRVIGFSRRGYLDSGTGPLEAPGSASADLAELLDHLGVARCHLLGAAAGAIVALDFALSHPARVDRLILSCTHMGLEDADHVAVGRALRPDGFDRMPADFRELGPAYRAAEPEGVARWLALEHAAIPGPRVRQRETNKLNWTALRGLRLAVLLIGGDADLWAPPPVYRRFAAAIPGSALRILPECGHSAHWEQPEAFNTAVLDFLSRA